MKRRTFLSTSLASACAAGLSFGSTRAQDAAVGSSAEQPSGSPSRRSKMNVIFIMADDQGWGDLGCYGHSVLQTPHMDSLAAEGARFTDFYVSMPICSPTRASCLTGRDPNRYGFKHVVNTGMVNPNVTVPVVHHLPTDEPTLPRLLRDAGYRTGTIGKWHLSLAGAHPSEPMPRDYGFDHAFICDGTQSLYQGPGKWMRDGEPVQVEAGRWYPEVYIDEAIRFIDAEPGRPFYLNLWSFTPHVREEAAEAWRARYPDSTPQEQTYYGCISQMDEQYGRLFRHLHETGLDKNTIVIFCSDNGPEPPVLQPAHEEARRGSTGGLRGSKHVIYEGGIRVPAIIRWPGMTTPGSVLHEPASVLDLLPTLCAMAEVALPNGIEFDGTDLRPALAGKPIAREHPLFWQCEYAMHTFVSPTYSSPPLALREGRWKLMTDMDFKRPELYDLAWDQSEQWNLAPVHPEIVARMSERLRAAHARVNDAASRDSNRWLNPNLPGYAPPAG